MYCVTEIILMCSPVIGQFFDTMIVASIARVDFLKVLSSYSSWPVGFALALATLSLKITFSLRSRVINKSRIKKRSTCGRSIDRVLECAGKYCFVPDGTIRT